MRKLPKALQRVQTENTHKGTAIAHESAYKHVTGRAQYLDDIPDWPDMLHLATAGAEVACALIEHIDTDAARRAPGVVDIITQADIPGSADVSPVFSGDLLLAGERVDYVGQPIVAVAAISLEAARRACALVKIRYRA